MGKIGEIIYKVFEPLIEGVDHYVFGGDVREDLGNLLKRNSAVQIKALENSTTYRLMRSEITIVLMGTAEDPLTGLEIENPNLKERQATIKRLEEIK